MPALQSLTPWPRSELRLVMDQPVLVPGRSITRLSFPSWLMQKIMACNRLEFAGRGKQVSCLHIYIGYRTLTLNTQLPLIIFDGLSIFIGVIDTDDGGSINMTCQDHRPYFVGVVTPSVWRPITLNPFLARRHMSTNAVYELTSRGCNANFWRSLLF